MKRNKNDVIEPTLVATYKDIFDDSQSDTVDNLLKNIRRDDVITICAFINSKFNSPHFKKWEFKFVNSILMGLDNNEPIINKFNQLQEKNHQQPIVFNIINSTRLINYSLKNLSNDIESTKINVDLELLKVFLLLNEEISNPINSLLNISSNYTYKEKYIRTLIPSFLINAEFIALKDVVTQSTKLKYFIEFAKTEYKEESKKILNNFNVNSWEDYLKNLLTLYLIFHEDKNGVSSEQIKTIIPFNHFDEKMKKFIKCFIINDQISTFNKDEAKDDNDFLLQRKYPIYLNCNNDIVILNINFLADHIFQTIYFEFKDLIKKSHGEKIADKLKSTYSFKFSQKILFENAIKNTVEKYSKVIRFDAEKQKEEYSDCYIRNGKKIYLLEFKDYLLSSKLKYSLDFDKISTYIIDRFIEAAGLSQITKVIKNIENGGFSFDKLNDLNYYKNNELVIYPIIVYSDLSFTFDGLNHIINQKFKAINDKSSSRFKIKDVVIIHLDLLIKHENVFETRKLNLFKLIDGYIHFIMNIKRKSKETDKVNPYEFLTFEQYFSIKMNQLNTTIENPKDFLEIGKALMKK